MGGVRLLKATKRETAGLLSRVARNRMRLRHKGPQAWQAELPFHVTARCTAGDNVAENVALVILHSIETNNAPAHPARSTCTTDVRSAFRTLHESVRAGVLKQDQRKPK